jgi:hypothetical protein
MVQDIYCYIHYEKRGAFLFNYIFFDHANTLADVMPTKATRATTHE